MYGRIATSVQHTEDNKNFICAISMLNSRVLTSLLIKRQIGILLVADFVIADILWLVLIACAFQQQQQCRNPDA